jgi:hypothetical protein
MTDWLPYLLTVAVSAGGSWIIFRIRFERFESMDTRREADFNKWQQQWEQTLREREAASQRYVESVHRLAERLSAEEKRMDGLHRWKHEVGEAYLPRAVDDHHRRLERIERKVFNGHREEDP